MAGVTPQQQQLQALQQQVLTQQLQTTITTTPEEEFLKRNTDCVYFLASPLTCKKGSECEYRHSDIARVNPRDCWYWLNGNCLNPKCAFRHPPLDGLLGAEAPTPKGPPVPQLQSPAVPAAQVPYVAGKQGVPCIFFLKGYCLKGDRCPFLHPPSSGSSKVAQSATVAPVTELPTLKKTFGGLEKCAREQKVLQANVQRSVELPPQGKPLARVEVSAMRNGVVVDKTVPTTLSVLGDDMPRYRPHSVPPATNEILNTRSNLVHQAHISDNDSILNGKDGDEFSREPSPGFDVLVDDELRDSDYYHSEEQFGRARGHDGRNMNPMNDYDLGCPSDFHSMADVERDIYRDPRDYDSYDRMQGHYGWEEQRRSSERMLGGSGHGERRRYPRDESPDQVDGLDLRHRISKQRRGNGLRSVVSREQTCESHAEDRNHRGGPHRENHLVTPHEGSLSSRLRGRIKLPGRSMSPVKEIDVRADAERDIDLGRHRRLSPSRPHVASSQGRLRDRIKGRVQEDLNDEGRDFRGRIRRDLITDNNTEFSAPKRLSELKSSKTAEGHELQMTERQSLGNRKYPKVESHQQSEDDLSFEGPKPLSEILKRKRGSESAATESGISAGHNNVYNNEKDGKESMIKSTEYDSNKEESYSASGEAGKQVQTEEVKAALKPELNEEVIEGMIGDDAMEDHELETYDQREEDFDYEQDDGEDYNLEGGENVEAEEEEYLDEEDGDDFAKKMGVVCS